MRKVIDLASLLAAVLVLCSSTHSNTTNLRKRALEGLADLRELSAYRAVKEAAWDEMRQQRYYSALKKLKYHQQLQPRDVEAYYLEGECLTRLERWKDAYIAFHKAFYLSGEKRYQDLMFKMKAKAGKPVVKEEPWYLKIKDPNEKVETPPAPVVQTPEVPIRRGSYLELSRMRMLQSLVDRYESKYGKITDFNLNSILEEKVTTRPVDVTELGKITIVDGQIRSENFGTVKDIRDSMKFFSEAVSMASEKNITGAIRALEASQDKLIISEAEYLIGLYREQQRLQDELAFRESLVKKYPEYYSNILFLADYYYENGANAKALQYYQKISNGNASNSNVIRRIKQLQAGGTHELRRLLDTQRENLLRKEVNP